MHMASATVGVLVLLCDFMVKTIVGDGVSLSKFIHYLVVNLRNTGSSSTIGGTGQSQSLRAASTRRVLSFLRRCIHMFFRRICRYRVRTVSPAPSAVLQVELK